MTHTSLTLAAGDKIRHWDCTQIPGLMWWLFSASFRPIDARTSTELSTEDPRTHTQPLGGGWTLHSGALP